MDPTGSSIPNASITLVNLSTNTTQKTNSGTDGTYRFAFVPPGNYKVTVSVEGFQTTEQAGVAVVAGQPTYREFPIATRDRFADDQRGGSGVHYSDCERRRGHYFQHRPSGELAEPGRGHHLPCAGRARRGDEHAGRLGQLRRRWNAGNLESVLDQRREL